ncbi:hypothetical protein C1H46_035616 [Malus baccata]|uniref:Beta-glucosidase n=1 Tax=Malus baccata TaxID=106549 RepID=A0A540KX93_MALBA|nr:hypothetical protein C1H46_035616 [Malus baccata]
MRQCPRLEMPRFSPKEKELLRGSIDFIGLNHYTTLYAKDCFHSPCPSGGDHAIRGYVNTTGHWDDAAIGELDTPHRHHRMNYKTGIGSSFTKATLLF